MKHSVQSSQFMTNLCDNHIMQERSRNIRSKINFFAEKHGEFEELAGVLSIIF